MRDAEGPERAIMRISSRPAHLDQVPLGAQAGPAKLTAAFRDAGFGTVEVATTTAYNLVINAAT